jgi:hypothetical protein
MLDTKQMIQDGFKKLQVAAVVTHDRNGKEHFIVVDTLEDAKKYKSSGDELRLVTMFVKA